MRQVSGPRADSEPILKAHIPAVRTVRLYRQLTIGENVPSERSSPGDMGRLQTLSRTGQAPLVCGELRGSLGSSPLHSPRRAWPTSRSPSEAPGPCPGLSLNPPTSGPQLGVVLVSFQGVMRTWGPRPGIW